MGGRRGAESRGRENAVSVSLVEGDLIAVRRNVGGRLLWHRRLVVALVPGGTAVVGIQTPDRDEYDKDVANVAEIVEWAQLPRGAIWRCRHDHGRQRRLRL